jgi:hypothetical protein
MHACTFVFGPWTALQGPRALVSTDFALSLLLLMVHYFCTQLCAPFFSSACIVVVAMPDAMSALQLLPPSRPLALIPRSRRLMRLDVSCGSPLGSPQMFSSASAFNSNIASWNTAMVSSMASVRFLPSQALRHIAWPACVSTCSIVARNSPRRPCPCIVGRGCTQLHSAAAFVYTLYEAATQRVGIFFSVACGSQMFNSATVFNQNIARWSMASVSTVLMVCVRAYCFVPMMPGFASSAVSALVLH